MTDPAKGCQYALVAATAASFLTPFMGSSVVIALPTIAAEFSMNVVNLSWVATAFLLSASVFLVPMGKIADVRGRRRVFLWGILIFTGASLLVSLSWSGWVLILFRVIHGIGSAMIFSTGMAIITAMFPPNERGRVLGINVAAVYLGLTLGPFLGGILTEHFGWRSIFVVTVPLGLAVLWLVHRSIPEDRTEGEEEKLDLMGCIQYGGMLAAIMFGLSELPQPRGAVLILAGLGFGVVFVWWECRVSHPLLDMGLFRRSRVFAFSNLAALIHYSATFAVGFLLSLYLQFLKGMSPQAAGTVLIAQPAIMAMLSPLAGKLSDRIEPRVVASAGMAVTAVGLFMFVFLHENASMGFVLVALLLIGLGFALFSSPNSNAVMSSVDRRSYGVASATLGTMRLIGHMLSMGIVTVIFATIIGRVQIRPESYPLFMESARIAFVVFVFLSAVGTFASLVRGRVREEVNAENGGNS
jgi:EmrB/QacA subfamily drug resistance transporter